MDQQQRDRASDHGVWPFIPAGARAHEPGASDRDHEQRDPPGGYAHPGRGYGAPDAESSGRAGGASPTGSAGPGGRTEGHDVRGAPGGDDDLPERRDDTGGGGRDDAGGPGAGRHGRDTTGYVPPGGEPFRGHDAEGDRRHGRADRDPGAGDRGDGGCDDGRRDGDCRGERDTGRESSAAREPHRGSDGGDPWRGRDERDAEGVTPGAREGHRGGDGGEPWGGRDEGTYRSSGDRQPPPASSSAGVSGYGQRSTYGRGGYGEGSGFTRDGARKGATGHADGSVAAGQERVLLTREQTYGQIGRRDAGNSGERSGGRHGASSRSASPPDAREHHGPRAYRRADARITEDIYDRLVGAEEIDSGDVTVGVQQGKVTLHGTVPERQMKHRIEDLAAACHGVEDIDNFVRVRPRYVPWWSPAPAPAAEQREARGSGDAGSAPWSGDAASTPMRSGATASGERGQRPSRADSSAAADYASVAGDTRGTNRSGEALTPGDGGLGTSTDAPRDGSAGSGVTPGQP